MLSALVADRAHIAELDAQIQDLEHSLALLQGAKALVKKRLDSYTYPVLTLPTEIIREIFSSFLPIYPLGPPLTGLLSPIILTHICGAWRQIALTFLALWRAIHISSEPPVCDLVSDVLSRSGVCPLSIRLDSHQLLAAVLPYSDRWEYFKLHISTTISELNLPCIDGPMPLLQHLALSWVGSGRPAFSFDEAPLLRTAILNDTAALNLTLPWSQLTSLTLTGIMDLQECFPIVQQASNLVHCMLELYHFNANMNVVDSDATFLFESLESLALVDPLPHLAKCINFLRALIILTIRSLDISERFLGSDPIDSLTSFISNSGCELQHVRIMGKTSVPLDSYHAAFPSIQNFVFNPAEF
ncbi:hypothetical protein K438DRAFT_1881356 [Mycena galopus ATCC 62051]|nr:hypothetical protein K438DRAFT_1881356 [Mycena galopus ATCC 62051]